MLNIVLPMAGRGSRFLNAGYKVPKPLIEIHGTPMIKLVVDNLMPKQEHRFIYVYVYILVAICCHKGFLIIKKL